MSRGYNHCQKNWSRLRETTLGDDLLRTCLRKFGVTLPRKKLEPMVRIELTTCSESFRSCSTHYIQPFLKKRST
jgi:hypothetical protein